MKSVGSTRSADCLVGRLKQLFLARHISIVRSALLLAFCTSFANTGDVLTQCGDMIAYD